MAIWEQAASGVSMLVAHTERGPMISRRTGVALLAIVTVVVIVAAFLTPRTPQPDAYHHFADQRPWAGIPRFGNVASNLPFAVIGLWGLVFLSANSARTGFVDLRERY